MNKRPSRDTSKHIGLTDDYEPMYSTQNASLQPSCRPPNAIKSPDHSLQLGPTITHGNGGQHRRGYYRCRISSVWRFNRQDWMSITIDIDLMVETELEDDEDDWYREYRNSCPSRYPFVSSFHLTTIRDI